MNKYNINDVVKDNDGDIAIIEKIEQEKYLLRFISPVVQGVAYWYDLGSFEKVTDKETIKDAKRIYTYLKNNNKFRRF